MTAFSLVTVAHRGTAQPAIEVGGRYWLLSQILDAEFIATIPRGIVDLFGAWDRNFDRLAGVAQRVQTLAAPIADDASSPPSLRTPLQYPNKVLLTGTNYYDHLRAVGRTSFTKADNFPAFFMKPPTTALVGPGPVRYPRGVTQYDWEVELAVVFGRKAKHVAERDALSTVAAYAIGLDMSARDLQRNARHFAKMDLCLGKAFDDSCPLGPRVVPAAFVGDPQDLDMKLWVNGRIEQDSNTRHMIWSVAEQIHEIAKLITFEPGDVLLTGTPAGTGIETNRYLSIGDRIEAEIEHLGRLAVQVVEDGAPA